MVATRHDEREREVDRLFAIVIRYHGQSVANQINLSLLRKDLDDGSLIKCTACGAKWPASLIDGKDDGSGQFTRLECPKCYGSNWLPT